MPRVSSEASQGARHALLHHDELQPCSDCRESRSRPRTGIAVHLAQLTAVFSIAFLLGFFYSEVRSARIQTQDGLLRPPGTTETEFYLNLTFSQRPTPDGERAWADLVPIGRGFVHHPEIAPFIAGITVFHQLHCLHAILVSYHSALDAANLQRNITPPDDFLNKTGTRMAPSHIRHCFDYIRQTIMCAADTNLEVLNRETHKTSGWGQPRICRDYESVFNWAEKWANSSDTGLIT
ncbi:uncharacterized protein BDW70DRAFT_33534 [Aspergillus foveolatus]|uniref:uncharacterized protein n=1 Tax=Aspergillus foveolatus TaxID=210207 RepID=UPI003CCCBDAC